MRFLPHWTKAGPQRPAAKGEKMVINCTPHDVDIYRGSDCCYMDGKFYLREDMDLQPFLTYPAAAEPARANFAQIYAGMADGILIFRWIPDEIVNLPEPKPGTYYIVSKMVAQACPEREDLIFPGTVVRDAEDHVVGYVDFSRV